MTPADLDHLERLARAATAGPWKHETQEGGYGERDYTTGHVISDHHNFAGNKKSRRDSVTSENSMTFSDGEFIAAMNPAVVLAWIAETRRLEAENAALREALEAIVRCEAPFSRDPLTHARNAVQHCRDTATAALTPPAETQETT